MQGMREGPPVCLILLLLLLAAGCGEPPGPPSFVLVSLDTTRADALSLYGFHERSTPLLDDLGRRGLVFEEMITVSENTLISHASMMTGLYPGAHGTSHRGNGTPLQESYQTLAEDFAAAGYQTAGFVAISAWLNSGFGFTQGFETFTGGFRGAEAVLGDARQWLDGLDPSRPYFLFIHIFDVHSRFQGQPYEAPAPWDGLYTSDYDGPLLPWAWQGSRGSKFLLGVGKGEISIGKGDLAYLRRLYDEGLSGADHQLGRFLRELSATHEDSWIIVTSDHGEEFLEHGKMMHASLFDEVMKVPLIIVPPRTRSGALGAPRFIRQQVGMVDLRPTLLSLAGLPPPVTCQGADLVPWLGGETGACPSKPAVIHQRAMRHEGFKLIREADGLRLFDLGADPRERIDVAGRPEMKQQLRALNRLLWNQIREDGVILREREVAVPEEKQLTDEKTAKMLENLGYVE
jgi:arylsulfatase A-like enzyme